MHSKEFPYIIHINDCDVILINKLINNCVMSYVQYCKYVTSVHYKYVIKLCCI